MSRPPRLAHFHYRGPYRYFLTSCTRDRQQTFRSGEIAALGVEQIRRTAREFGFAVLAYCLMPDHMHLLVEGNSPGADLRRFMKRLKQRTGQMCAARIGAALWQEGYVDRVLRADEDAKQVARYIVENPVRAQLVRSPADYPYVGSGVWTLADLLESVR